MRDEGRSRDLAATRTSTTASPTISAATDAARNSPPRRRSISAARRRRRRLPWRWPRSVQPQAGRTWAIAMARAPMRGRSGLGSRPLRPRIPGTQATAAMRCTRRIPRSIPRPLRQRPSIPARWIPRCALTLRARVRTAGWRSKRRSQLQRPGRSSTSARCIPRSSRIIRAVVRNAGWRWSRARLPPKRRRILSLPI